jgi:hypothetical protein
MRKITDYNEFILESKLELLLEANIEYTDKFKDILRSIDCLLVHRTLYLNRQRS